MDKLLKFMEFGCLDPKLYWRIPDPQVELSMKFNGEKTTLLPGATARLAMFSGSLVAQVTNGKPPKEKIDVVTLESKVKYSVLQQVAYADRILKNAPPGNIWS